MWMDWGWHMGWMALWWIVVLAIIVGIVWMIAAAQRGVPAGHGHSAESILKDRYARGEIDHDEFVKRLDDIRR